MSARSGRRHQDAVGIEHVIDRILADVEHGRFDRSL